MAVAFTSYDNEREIILDPSIAELEFYVEEWGKDENGQVFVNLFTISSHSCTPEELGLTGEKSKFYPYLQDNIKDEVVRYWKKFRCIDEEDLRIYGGSQSEKARRIGARLMKCHDKDYCMPDEMIENFLYNKYLLLVNNQIRFDSEKLDEESVVAESTTRWFMID